MRILPAESRPDRHDLWQLVTIWADTVTLPLALGVIGIMAGLILYVLSISGLSTRYAAGVILVLALALCGAGIAYGLKYRTWWLTGLAGLAALAVAHLLSVVGKL
jgi:hypothetical protein